MNKILVVAAHPDDEILGCGATMAKFSEEGNIIHILILGEGITSRQDIRNSKASKAEIDKLHLEAKEAAKIVGAKSVEVLKFPDNRFDTIPLLDIIKAVEIKKQEIKPDIVFTHHAQDLNIDHRKTFQAVLTACRPVKNETVREIFSFEIPSSTEWQAQTSTSAFLPTQYIVITESHLKAKTEAIEIYTSEVKNYPHPRSSTALKLLAEWRGINIGARYAESFEMVRRIL